MVEPNHVLGQLRKRHLCLQNVLLRHLPGGVLDSRLINRLARNCLMLIVNPHLVVGEQQVIEGLVHAHPNIQAYLLQIGLRLIHAGFGNIRPQRQLSPSRESLADAEHVLRVVIIPRLFEWYSPSAIHRHGIVEHAGRGNVRLGNGNASCCNCDFGIRGKGNPFGFIKRQGWPRSLGLVVFTVLPFDQDCKARQAIVPCGRLRTRETHGPDNCKNTKCGKKRFHDSLQRRLGARAGRCARSSHKRARTHEGPGSACEGRSFRF